MSGCENTALFERLMEIHSNSPKLYYGFNAMDFCEFRSEEAMFFDTQCACISIPFQTYSVITYNIHNSRRSAFICLYSGPNLGV